MNIIPAIDLYQGQRVRLQQAQFESVQYYHSDPLALASQYSAEGARALHVVDLNGACSGQMTHIELLTRLAAHSQLALQVGGGIRQANTVRTLLEAGVSRVVLGSMAVNYPQWTRHMLEHYGSTRFVLALDITNQHGTPMVLTQGWQQKSGVTLWQILKVYQDLQGLRVMCTDTMRDGMMGGPNRQLYQWCIRKFPHLCFQASGGVSCLSDLQALSQAQVPEAVVGKALYEGNMTLRQAVEQATLN